MAGIETNFINTLSQFGLGIAVTVVLVFILIFVLRWVVRQQERINARADEREDKMLVILEGYRASLQDLAEQIKIAGQFQRKEHNDLKEAFDRIEQTIKDKI